MSFLAPLGLLLGLLGIPLAAMYFLRIRRKKIRVPSLLLWDQFMKSERLASPFQRFRARLLFLLQLLMLLALAFAFSRPYLNNEVGATRSVILVVDVSASMGSTDVKPNRVAGAVDSALDALRSVDSSDEVMVVTAGARTEVLIPFTRDLSKVRDALAGIKVTESEGSLREGLELALSLSRSRPGVEVFVFSDGSGESLSDLSASNARIHFTPIGTSAANSGILAVDIRRSPVSDLDRELFVTVQNFGPAAVEGSLEVSVDGKMEGLRNDTLPPDTPISMVFSIPASATGAIRIELDAPGDENPIDDLAFLVAKGADTKRVALVGGDQLTARALLADPRVELTIVPSGTFDTKILAEVDCTLFAAPVPPGLDGHNYAVLGPWSGGPVGFGDEAKKPQILGWRRTHQTMRFVDWDGVHVGRTQTVNRAGGLVPIVDADTGPLILAGEVGGGRVFQMAFDPLKSDLPLRVAWPVMLLNTVTWMTEGGAAGQGSQLITTGNPYLRRLPEGIEVASAKGPTGNVELSLSDGLLRIQDTGKIGVYTITAGGEQTQFAANLLSARESRIAPRSSVEIGTEAGVPATASLAGRQELWRPLVLFMLGILLLEWFLWHRRRFV